MSLNKIACTEVFDVLSYMEKTVIMKIPFEVLNLIKENRDLNYISRVDKNDIFNPNNLSEESISILAWLDLEYLASKESKIEKLKIYQKNEEIYQQKLREKYKIDNLFKNYEQCDSKDNCKINIERSNQIIVYKENIFFRILKKIKTLLQK